MKYILVIFHRDDLTDVQFPLSSLEEGDNILRQLAHGKPDWPFVIFRYKDGKQVGMVNTNLILSAKVLKIEHDEQEFGIYGIKQYFSIRDQRFHYVPIDYEGNAYWNGEPFADVDFIASTDRILEWPSSYTEAQAHAPKGWRPLTDGYFIRWGNSR